MQEKIFSKETKDRLVKVIDDAIEINAFVETIDGPAIRVLIGIIENYADKYVDSKFDELINQVANFALDKDFESALQSLGLILDSLIDIEEMSDENERLIFVDGMRFIGRLLTTYLNKAKATQ